MHRGLSLDLGRTLYLVVRGEATIQSDGTALSEVGEYYFVGEMGFLQYMDNFTASDTGDSAENVVTLKAEDVSGMDIDETLEAEDASNYVLESTIDHRESVVHDAETKSPVAEFADIPLSSGGVQHSPPNPRTPPLALEAVVTSEDGATVYAWDYSELAENLSQLDNRGVANALLAYVCHEMREKVEDAWQDRLLIDKRRKDEEAKILSKMMGELLE